jgi:transcriptional regulator with XRE-family HTH domain
VIGADILIARAGRALYGERWQTSLARALGVTDRTVRRWAAGQAQPSRGVYADLASLVEQHRADLGYLLEPLRAVSRARGVGGWGDGRKTRLKPL